jgi:hypothetical protein
VLKNKGERGAYFCAMDATEQAFMQQRDAIDAQHQRKQR